MEAPFKDKRYFTRLLVKLPVKLIRKFSNIESQGETNDISANGVGLITSEDVEPHSHLDLSIQFPDGHDPLCTQGEVVWSKMLEVNKYAVGICLFQINLLGMAGIVKIAHSSVI